MTTPPSDKHLPCASAGIACRPATYCAPAGRDTPDEFSRKAALLEGVHWLGRVLDAMPGMVMILNGHRQIVAANEIMLTLLHAARQQVLEKRPGEALGCIRTGAGPDGCGTAPHCVTCGALAAILRSRSGEKTVRECRILAETPSGIAPMDLRATASPFEILGERFTLVAVEDISHSKQLATMQRLFFHDVLNTAGCLSGYAQCFREEGSLDRESGDMLVDLSDQLVESLRAQRDLVFAESGDLVVEHAAILAGELVEELRAQYGKHPIAEGRTVKTASIWDGVVISDRRLLNRVLGNMIKNALEATPRGQTVILSLHDRGDEAVFAVHNAEAIPEQVQFQIFQRSFSTKGEPGRGLGTYSMKLLGERYLGGKLDFTSTPKEGTTFTLTIPKIPREPGR